MAEAGDVDTRMQALLELFAALAGDLEVHEVLQRMVDAARRLFEARGAWLVVLDPAGATGDIVSSGGVTVVRGPHKVPASGPGDLELEIPVRGLLYGRLFLEHRRAAAGFTPADRTLAEALAAAAGVAIDNAGIYRDARLRARWLEASMHVGRMLVDSAPGRRGGGLDPVTELIRRESGSRQVLLLMPVGEGPVYRVSSAAGSGRRRMHGRLLEPGTPELLTVAGNGVPAVLGALPELGELGAIGGESETLAVDLHAHGIHYGLLLLVRAAGAEPFTDTDQEMSAVLGANIGQGLGLERLHRLREQVLLFSDRERIARDLHDVVIQRIFAAGLSIQALGRHLDSEAARTRALDITGELDETIRELRETIYALRSSAGEAEQLSSRILRAVRTASEPLPFTPQLRLSGPLDGIDDEAVISNLLAVLTESVSNAVRHAAAESISVEVVAGPDALRLQVRDDGAGMSFPVTESGLANMGQRARELGGRFSVDSKPGAGTTVKWRVPLP
ncbi:sensor histidine kinase [Paeniglutamicibacter cryotolerans]|uniref:Signal transduction histidine kinase n=1 Tax=Paeniglutamicibacter cryotolerans TaxID=670079 RepID=A0A839QKR6_9MICC|nr:sensor histidine kinase [Paeniglutamicibacter cryotolerans]MBB2996447.1 signal transduction histidine kinase [Paeniglutamicibacter cryotolerans]